MITLTMGDDKDGSVDHRRRQRRTKVDLRGLQVLGTFAGSFLAEYSIRRAPKTEATPVFSRVKVRPLVSRSGPALTWFQILQEAMISLTS
jgi:hypothetical protein